MGRCSGVLVMGFLTSSSPGFLSGGRESEGALLELRLRLLEEDPLGGFAGTRLAGGFVEGGASSTGLGGTVTLNGGAGHLEAASFAGAGFDVGGL